ncbi:hypothetical protein BDR07DRAFT_1488718 [Suillus spraguei]|nr:hypothetical protein BDR07DRAFT_1488718 [Suillus spraguei]
MSSVRDPPSPSIFILRPAAFYLGFTHRNPLGVPISNIYVKPVAIKAELQSLARILNLQLLLKAFQSPDNPVNRALRCIRDAGVPSGLDESIELHHFFPPGHSFRSECLNNLSNSLRDRFKQQGVPSDFDETFSLFLQLPHMSHASWATAAEETNHARYSFIVFLTSFQRLEDGHGVASRGRFLVQRSPWRVDDYCGTGGARSCSILDPFGTPLENELKELSFRLYTTFDQSTEDQSPHIRQLTMQWNDIVSCIRILPDLSRFLLPPLFSDLQKAAQEGPVIIVNASQYSCDALIVLSEQNPIHIPIGITRTYYTVFLDVATVKALEKNGAFASKLILKVHRNRRRLTT